MAKKKGKGGGASRLPSDDFTWTEGQSFGLDTFLHDMEDGEGVQQSARLPQTKGLSRLPGVDAVEESSFSQAPMGTSTYTHGPGGRLASDDDEDDFAIGLGDERMDGLRGLLASDADADDVRLPALDWLEMAEQDPKRLPKNPVDLASRELEEAWGVHRRTDGIAVYDDTVEVAGDFRLTEANTDLDAARYESLMDAEPETRHRFSSADLKLVVAEAMRRSAAGESLRDILIHTARMLEDEAPRVKKAMQAVASEHGLAGKVFIRSSAYPGCHNGEWTDHVKKHAKQARYVVASSKCSDCVHHQCGSCAVFQRRLVASVPWSEARDVYRPRFETEGVRLASKGDPKEALRKAFGAKVAKKTPETQFPKEDHSVERLDSRLREAGSKSSFDAIQEIKGRQQERRRMRLAAYMSKLVSAGLLTKKQARALIKEGGQIDEIKTRVAAVIARKDIKRGTHDTGESEHILGRPREIVRKLTAHEKAVRKVAKKAGVRPSEVNGMLQWLREEIHSGFAGRELDGLIRQAFAKPLRKAASRLIRDLRDKHEGLAGHLYIDAETYGGERGVKGCEEGALKHRTNDIPYVLKMSSCGSCVHCNQHGRCNKYGKELVEPRDFEAGELETYQADTIRMADAPDAEKTASIFAPVENPVDEWELGNQALEDIDYYGEEDPEPEEEMFDDLGGVFDGGMDLPEEW
jgi:hypothetical protein